MTETSIFSSLWYTLCPKPEQLPENGCYEKIAENQEVKIKMVGVVLIVRENSLYAQKCEFFNSFKIGCEKLRKILRKG